MAEYLPENEHPLNQAALKLLYGVGWIPSVDSLYVVQLLFWAFENYQTGVEPTSAEEEWPLHLHRLKPEQAMNILTGRNKEEPLLELHDLDGLCPSAAVARILEALRLLPE